MDLLEVRGATNDDGLRLAEIDYESWSWVSDPGALWSSTRPFFGPPTGTLPEEVLVGVVDKAPVGFIKVQTDADDEHALYIGGLAVDARYRRRGVAAALLDAALAHAAQRNRTRMWLKVLGSNRAAIGLYQSRGFVVSERLEVIDVRGRLREDLRMEWLAAPCPTVARC